MGNVACNRERLSLILALAVAAPAIAQIGCGRGQSGGGDDPAIAQVASAIIQPQVASISVPAGVDFKPLAVGASSALTVSDRAQLLGTAAGTFAPSTSTGTTQSTYGSQVKVGSVTSLPAVTVGSGATVAGSITSGSTVTGAPAGTTVLANQPLAATTFQWTVPFNTSMTPVTLNSGSRTLAPGSYGTVQVNGGTLTLGPGTYFIDTLNLNSGTNLTLNNASFIYVKSSLAFRTHVTGTAQNLLMVYFGTTGAAIESTFLGTFVAPNASIRIGVGGTPHVGALFARSIVVDPDVKLTQTTFARWDQVPFDVGVSPTLNCVVQLSPTTFGAVFGYSNTTGATITLGTGPHNFFSPGTADLGQPILFVPGQVPIATFQTFAAGSQLSLTIGQQAVTASSSSPACPADLAAALTQLYTETADSLAVRQSLANLIAHPRYAASVAALKANAGSQLTPFELSLIDAAQLAIANADLLGDPAALTDAQRARLPAFRASLFANPAVLRMRLAGDALKGAGGTAGCDALKQIDGTPLIRSLLPPQPDSVNDQVLALAHSASMAAVRSTLSAVANGPQSAALLAAPGALLAATLSQSDFLALDLAGPIPTGLLGKIIGGISGAVAGAIGGLETGGLLGAIGGGIVGGIVGAWGGNEIENDSCQHCGGSGECGAGVCVDQCCADLSTNGFSISYLTGVSCPNGESQCHDDGQCPGGTRCAGDCCIDQTILVSLCPGNGCTSNDDCSAGTTCQDGCCAGVCGVNGTTCDQVASVTCGLPGGDSACAAGETCQGGCCRENIPPPPH
jgi:hypothetical protein